MALNFQTLRPYQSFLLGQFSETLKPDGLVNKILADLREVLRLRDSGRAILSQSLGRKQGQLEVGGLHYRVRKRPPWTTDSGIEDQINHLVLVFRHDHRVAIHLSETSLKKAVLACFGASTYQGLGRIERLTDRILNEAFINGPARTLWMSSVLRRSTIKPDSKTLTGTNLRDALDPLTDQGYQVTAVRSAAPTSNIKATVGVSPRGSRLWVGASSNWSDCSDVVVKALDHLGGIKKGRKRALPFVAIADGDLGHVGTAYDVAIIPPQLLMDDPSIDPEALKNLEHWSDHTSFQIEDQKGSEISLSVKLEGNNIGILQLRLVARKQGRIGVQATATGTDEIHTLAKHCEKDEWLRVWFDSGHTLSGDSLFEVQHQDFPFRNFQWDNFDGFDVTKEKPYPKGGSAKDYNPDLIGKSDSLFCWAYNKWPPGDGKGESWLVCDDGSMELADFIHLQGRKLTLIHAKGATVGGANRRLSVPAYEVVVSQAVKNLRWLELAHLSEGLAASLDKKVAKAVWRDRKKATREDFLHALKALGSDYEREVVILQPHITRGRLAASRTSAHKTESAQYRQIMTLLNGARTACVGLGAELWVVGHDVATARARQSS